MNHFWIIEDGNDKLYFQKLNTCLYISNYCSIVSLISVYLFIVTEHELLSALFKHAVISLKDNTGV